MGVILFMFAVIVVIVIVAFILAIIKGIHDNTCPNCKSLNNTEISTKIISQKQIQIEKEEELRHYSSDQTFAYSVKPSQSLSPDSGVTVRKYTVPGVRETFEVLHRCDDCGTLFTSHYTVNREV